MKKKIVMLIIACIVGIGISNNNKVEAAGENILIIDAQLNNLTNPGKVFTENDELQVVIKITPVAAKITNFNYTVEEDDYRIDGSTVRFSGELEDYGAKVNGDYNFKLMNMTKGNEYTLTYSIYFTGTVMDEPVIIDPLFCSYSGSATDPTTFFCWKFIWGR